MQRNILIAIAAAVVLVGTIWFFVTQSGPTSPPSAPASASTPYETDPNLEDAAERGADSGRIGGSAQERPGLGEKLGLGGGKGGSGGSGGGSGSGGGGGFKVPQNKGELILLVLAGLLIVAGCYLVKKEPPNLLWGFSLLGVGIAGLLFEMGTAGLHFSLNPAKFSFVFWILVSAWTVSKLTGFTKIDDYIVTLGSIGMLALSLVGGGLLGRFNPFTTQWWVLELIWIFLIAEAILKGLAARRTLQILLLVLGWFLLGAIS